jgi:transcriptional regulator with XRE-family HTH domain
MSSHMVENPHTYRASISWNAPVASRNLTKAEIPVGKVIRQFRRRQRLSVRGLANKCGFSASFISQVELGRASPSIASTERLTCALGVTLGELFRAATPATSAVTRRNQRPIVQSAWSRARIEALRFSDSTSRLEALLITLKQGGASSSRPYTRPTEQLALVLQGSIELFIENEQTRLSVGDSAALPAGIRHSWLNRSRRICQILLISPR